MRIVLYQPEIAQNVGTIIRLAACWGVGIDLIEPLGFIWGGKDLKRAAMDYADSADVQLHKSWEAYADKAGNLVIMAPHQAVSLYDYAFQTNDALLFGRESTGIPQELMRLGPKVAIPMLPGVRSINLALSVAIVAGEALRQLNLMPMLKAGG